MTGGNTPWNLGMCWVDAVCMFILTLRAHTVLLLARQVHFFQFMDYNSVACIKWQSQIYVFMIQYIMTSNS